jgi:flagellar biogenesis protein FliO
MDVVQQFAAILFVFVLLGAAIVVLRRKNVILMGRPRSAGQPRRLCVVDRVRLTPQHSVHIVQAGEREFIIAAHSNGCTLLASGNADVPGVKDK